MKPPSRRKRGAVVLGNAKKPPSPSHLVTKKMASPSRKLYHFSLYFLVPRARPPILRASRAFRLSSSAFNPERATLLPLSFSDDFLDSRCRCCSDVSPTFARLQCVRLQPRLFSPILSFYLRPFFSALVFFLLSTFALPHLSLLLSLPFYFYVFYSLFLFSSLFLSLFFSLFLASLTGCFPSARSSPNLIFSIQVCTLQ